MEQLFKPKKINYELRPKSINPTSKELGDRRKPVIDYKIKIKNLENEIHITSQNFNDTRARNENLRRELDEMRKGMIVRKEKVEKMFEELIEQETQYKEQKRKVEIELNKREINMEEEIDKKTNDLAEKNNHMIRKIKENDEKITKILAKKKHINHERVKLEEKENYLMEYWQNKNEEFLMGKQEKINKLKDNHDTDKVLDAISGEKIDEFREIVNKLNKADSDEDDVTKITRLLEYFINKINEVKHSFLKIV